MSDKKCIRFRPKFIYSLYCIVNFRFGFFRNQRKKNFYFTIYPIPFASSLCECIMCEPKSPKKVSTTGYGTVIRRSLQHTFCVLSLTVCGEKRRGSILRSLLISLPSCPPLCYQDDEKCYQRLNQKRGGKGRFT